MKTKTVTKTVTELSAKETGDILCKYIADKLNADGSLGTVLVGTANDLDGLAAEVLLTFEWEREG